MTQTILKTQISHLVSGKQNQVLNSNFDYSCLPKSTQHFNHAGSNSSSVNAVTELLKTENPEYMTIRLFDHEITLKANWSMSRKSCYWSAELPLEIANNHFVLAKNETPRITISDASTIEISNGKNSFKYVCPTLVTIL